MSIKQRFNQMVSEEVIKIRRKQEKYERKVREDFRKDIPFVPQRDIDSYLREQRQRMFRSKMVWVMDMALFQHRLLGSTGRLVQKNPHFKPGQQAFQKRKDKVLEVLAKARAYQLLANE